MAPPQQSRLLNRGTPNFYRAFAERWNKLQEQDGSFYLGPALAATKRAPLWRPHRGLVVGNEGIQVIRNQCLHGMKYIIDPTLDNLPQPLKGSLMCSWHQASYSHGGKLERCGAMPIQPSDLKVKACPTFESREWQGIVFELGRDTKRARERLEATLAFLEEKLGKWLNFKDRALLLSMVSPQESDLLTTLLNYLDCRHVRRGHAETLALMLDTEKYLSAVGPDGTIIQWMGFKESWFETPLGRYYQEMGWPRPEYGAIWVTLPDGTMIEIYFDQSVVVSQGFADPKDWRRCVLYHDFYYPIGTPVAFAELHRADVFDPTGKEDEEPCSQTTANLDRAIDEGMGDVSVGFFEPIQEDQSPLFLHQVAERLSYPLTE